MIPLPTIVRKTVVVQGQITDKALSALPPLVVAEELAAAESSHPYLK